MAQAVERPHVGDLDRVLRLRCDEVGLLAVLHQAVLVAGDALDLGVGAELVDVRLRRGVGRGELVEPGLLLGDLVALVEVRARRDDGDADEQDEPDEQDHRPGESARRATEGWDAAAAESYEQHRRQVLVNLDRFTALAVQVSSSLRAISSILTSSQKELDRSWEKVALVPHEVVGESRHLVFKPDSDEGRGKVSASQAETDEIRARLRFSLDEESARLRAARADKAKAFVLAIDDVEDSLRVAEVVRTNFPDLPIYARARDRTHVHKLMDLGVNIIERETFLSALELTRSLLRGLGLPAAEVKRLLETFRRQDEKRLYQDYQYYTDLEKVRANAQTQANIKRLRTSPSSTGSMDQGASLRLLCCR